MKPKNRKDNTPKEESPCVAQVTGVTTLDYVIGTPLVEVLWLRILQECLSLWLNAASDWLYIVPWGMRKAMNYLKSHYGNPPVIVIENGVDEINEPQKSLQEALEDQKRIDYHKDYLSNLLLAIKEDGCNVTGYFAWSLLDNWEWSSGFTVRFGLHFVDYKSPTLTRYAKKSALWFSDFLQPY
ncbi:hypothetical protein AAC387_Pa10g0504 [Persea americana]